jgi:hypothetical protein
MIGFAFLVEPSTTPKVAIVGATLIGGLGRP